MESGQEGMNKKNNPVSIEKMREDQQREGMDIEQAREQEKVYRISLSEVDMNVQKESSEKKNTKRIGIAGKWKRK